MQLKISALDLRYRTEEDLVALADESDLLCSVQGFAYETLARGTEPEEQGVKWKNLHLTPSVRIDGLPVDWTIFDSFELVLKSDAATLDVIVCALRFGSVIDPAYSAVSFSVDWVGWKRVMLSLADMAPLIQHPSLAVADKPERSTPFLHSVPQYDGVKSLCLFAKAWGQNPSPETSLTLGELKFWQSETERRVPPLPDKARISGVRVLGATYLADSFPIAHGNPEVGVKGPSLPADFQHQAYYRHERSLHDYYPAYVPGPVSVDPGGAVYVLGAGHLVQWMAHGRWHHSDLRKPVCDFLARLKVEEVAIDNVGTASDLFLRWDADGDCYVIVHLSAVDLGLPRRALLLHSTDRLDTWSVYELGEGFYRFEQHVGWNHDCLTRPPVVLGEQNLSVMILPCKLQSGQLDFSHRVAVAVPRTDALGRRDFVGFAFVAGSANAVVSVRDNVFVVYGRANRAGASGVQAFVQRYDRVARHMSASVLVGNGGHDAADVHNWPSLAIGANSRLHVLINGHHDPFTHVVSREASDERLWGLPETVSSGTSYLALVCDPDGTLFGVSRRSSDGYRMKLSLHRLRKGASWEQIDIVSPQKPYYRNWHHRLSVNPQSGDLYLSYFAIGIVLQDFEDEHAAFRFRHPDLQVRNRSLPALGTDAGRTGKPRRYGDYAAPPQEPVTLISKNHGESWALMISEDFDRDGRRRL